MKMNEKYISCWVCWVAIFVSCNVLADEASHDQAVLALLRQQLAESVVSLGEQIVACEEKKGGSNIKKLSPPDFDKTNDQHVEDFLVGVSYHYFTNQFACEKQARLEMAYALGALSAVEEELTGTSLPSQEINSALIYPPVGYYEYVVKYQRLPEAWRDYFASVIDDQLFELIDVIEANGLLSN